MTVVMTVDEVLDALRPVTRAMLDADEVRRARFWIAQTGERDDAWPGETVVDESMNVAWKIVGDRGSSGGLLLCEDVHAMLFSIADDLQDFIAESSFAWGQLRPIPPIPPIPPIAQ